MEQDGALERHPGQSLHPVPICWRANRRPGRSGPPAGYEALAADSLADVVSGKPTVTYPEAEWQRFVGGDAELAGFFTGKAMQATQGKANGKAVAAELRSRRG